MKYYKLKNSEIMTARHNEPLQCLGADGIYSYYESKSDERLRRPFVEIEELEIPEVFRVLQTKEKNISAKEQEVQEALSSFSSNALGMNGIYDSDLVQQANLVQILSLNKGGKLRVRLEGEEKQYIPHTKEQVEQVMSDWVKHKDKILSDFEEFKRGI